MTDHNGEHMSGGWIVQTIPDEEGVTVEVLTESLNRYFRYLPNAKDLEIGDLIFWQNMTAVQYRPGIYEQRKIGSCFPASHPG